MKSRMRQSTATKPRQRARAPPHGIQRPLLSVRRRQPFTAKTKTPRSRMITAGRNVAPDWRDIHGSGRGRGRGAELLHSGAARVGRDACASSTVSSISQKNNRMRTTATGVINTVLTISSHEYGGAPGPSVPFVKGSNSPAPSGLPRSRAGRRCCMRPLSEEPNMGSIFCSIPPPSSSTDTAALSGTLALAISQEPATPPWRGAGSAASSMPPTPTGSQLFSRSPGVRLRAQGRRQGVGRSRG